MLKSFCSLAVKIEDALIIPLHGHCSEAQSVLSFLGWYVLPFVFDAKLIIHLLLLLIIMYSYLPNKICLLSNNYFVTKLNDLRDMNKTILKVNTVIASTAISSLTIIVYYRMSCDMYCKVCSVSICGCVP